MKRTLLLAAAAISLGGCNLVYSETPLFTAADARGAPQFRPGVWAERKDGCEVDTSRPVDEWPECAGGAVITPTAIEEKDDKPTSTNYLLAGGDPQVMQLAVELDPKKPAIFMYAGVRPLERDPGGMIVEAELWIAQCGPPPPQPVEAPEGVDEVATELDEELSMADNVAEAVRDPLLDEGLAEDLAFADDTTAEVMDGANADYDTDRASDEDEELVNRAAEDEGLAEAEAEADAAAAEAFTEDALQAEVDKAMAEGVTREPLPGLEVKEGMCLARAQGPVRAAVAASPQWEKSPPSRIYWVRDGDR